MGIDIYLRSVLDPDKVGYRLGPQGQKLPPEPLSGLEGRSS